MLTALKQLPVKSDSLRSGCRSWSDSGSDAKLIDGLSIQTPKSMAVVAGCQRLNLADKSLNPTAVILFGEDNDCKNRNGWPVFGLSRRCRPFAYRMLRIVEKGPAIPVLAAYWSEMSVQQNSNFKSGKSIHCDSDSDCPLLPVGDHHHSHCAAESLKAYLVIANCAVSSWRALPTVHWTCLEAWSKRVAKLL